MRRRIARTVFWAQFTGGLLSVLTLSPANAQIQQDLAVFPPMGLFNGVARRSKNFERGETNSNHHALRQLCG